MSRALSLAEQGKYSTTPNPRVGCVIVNAEGEVVGEGFHQKAGQAHAEINALNVAKAQSKGACAYVTLEPCAHTNRTGPCSEALIQAGIRRVVIACVDPNPKVAGKGIQQLQNAGVEVQVGLLQQQATALNKHFFYRMQHKMPFVTLKLAASMDGKTALANGESKWITSEQARRDVQIHRAECCAILTGADTILADNPQLNVRDLPADIADMFAIREKQPARFIVDGKNRLHQDLTIFNDGQHALVYNVRQNAALSTSQQHQIDKLGEFVDLTEVLKDVVSREVNHLWVEAGATLAGALLQSQLVNELILYQAPQILGSSARGLVNIDSPNILANALTGVATETTLVGCDIKSRFVFDTCAGATALHN